MPCTVDPPSRTNVELQRAARLLEWLLQKLGQKRIPWVHRAAYNDFTYERRSPIELCKIIRGMSQKERERIIYDAHDVTARDLANWWDEHEENDRRHAAEA